MAMTKLLPVTSSVPESSLAPAAGWTSTARPISSASRSASLEGVAVADLDLKHSPEYRDISWIGPRCSSKSKSAATIKKRLEDQHRVRTEGVEISIDVRNSAARISSASATSRRRTRASSSACRASANIIARSVTLDLARARRRRTRSQNRRRHDSRGRSRGQLLAESRDGS